jgi:general secretion pathway protein H
MTKGFTLVELMVVLVIIGLAAGAVVMAIPEPGGSLAGEAERFAARTKAARDTAILESRATMVRIDRGGYDVAGRRGGAWQVQAHHDWIERTIPELAGTGAAAIRFDSTGFAEPARVVLRRGGDRAVIDVSGDGGVHVGR